MSYRLPRAHLSPSQLTAKAFFILPEMRMVLSKIAWPRNLWSECWDWSASLDGHGYGQFRWPDSKAYRLTFMHFRGLIPGGKELDHLCRNKRCVNPWHLEPVPHQINVIRAHATRSTCKYGHPLEMNPYRPRRWCKRCHYDRCNARKRGARRGLQAS